ncbi:insulinase family protein [Candidatus Dojkabacteria bacterium]|nr:insulinase family protein [Candidatus Dojkabacteria bacterium]
MKINRTKFKNGVRILHYYLPTTNSVSLCILFKTGPVDEKPEEYGLAHFIEHSTGDGTRNYPDKKKADFLLETLGVVENAWTGKNATCYWMKSPIKNFSKAADILFDKITNPLFREESVQKQKRVIIEEIKMRRDDPNIVAWDALSENIFASPALSHINIGSEKTVSSFNQDMLFNFFKKNYHFNNALIWIGGNIKFDEVLKVLGKFKLPKGPEKKETKYEKASGKYCTFHKMDISSAYVYIGINGFPIDKKNYYQLALANTILGEGEGSFLNQSLKVQNPLVSATGSEIISFTKDGLLLTFFISSNDNITKACNISFEQIKRVLDGNINGSLLDRAKNLMKTEFASLQETSDKFVCFSSDYSNLPRFELLTGRKKNLDDILNTINLTTINDIRKSFQETIKNSKIVVSVSGPDPKVKGQIDKILEKSNL